MPHENDWVLYAPYSDKTLMRNHLVYGLWEKMGHYSPRCRWVELILNGRYHGVYVLMEKIKEDPNRVDTDQPNSDDSKDVFLLEMTFKAHIHDSAKFVRGPISGHYFIIKYPRGKWLTDWRKKDIQDFVSGIEKSLYVDGPYERFSEIEPHIDLNSLIDFYIVNEAFRNPDAFSASTFLYKTTDQIMYFGPVWDFNLAMGNYQFSEHVNPAGMCLPEKDWAGQLTRNEWFRQALDKRWKKLRTGIFSDENIADEIWNRKKKLENAQKRNFERWPILGKHVWPNPKEYIRDTHREEVGQMIEWIQERFHYLDTAYGRIENYQATYLTRIRNQVTSKGCDQLTEFYKDLKEKEKEWYIFDNYSISMLGYGYERSKEFDCAVKVFEIATEEYPNESSLYFHLAKNHDSLANYALARENYKKCFELDPDATAARVRYDELRNK